MDKSQSQTDNQPATEEMEKMPEPGIEKEASHIERKAEFLSSSIEPKLESVKSEVKESEEKSLGMSRMMIPSDADQKIQEGEDNA